MFKWWKVDGREDFRDVLYRMANAVERQAKAVELSHQAAADHARSATIARLAAARKYEAEQKLAEDEIERRRRADVGGSSTNKWPDIF